MSDAPKKQNFFVRLFIFIVLLSAGFYFSDALKTLHPKPYDVSNLSFQSGTLLHPSMSLPDVPLLYQNQQTTSLHALSGHWTLLFLGFTRCPKLCPTSMHALANLHQNLLYEKLPHSLEIVFLSIDSEHDTPEMANQYAQYFSPDFHGLVVPLKIRKTLLNALHLAAINAKTLPEHSGTVVLLNPDAQLQGYFTQPIDADKLIRDLEPILSRT